MDGLTFSLDMEVIYAHAENVITSMLPAVYLLAGLGLGFVVISKIVSAFR